MQSLASIPTRGHTIAYTPGVVKTRVWLRQWRFARSNVLGSPVRPSTAWKRLRRSTEKGICKSELLQDAPFVAAIGACIISSLVLQKKEDQSSSVPLGEDDVRNGAITIISFIPVFNWLGWVFAWLDTNEPRYLFYASVYLAPYVRSGFPFSSDENWLLILSYFACIAHTQLEINSDLVGVESRMTFLQEGLRNLRQKVKIELPKKQSKNSHESLASDHEDLSLPAEEDFSQIELSEFDKKLSGTREDGESSENTEKGSQRADISDE